MDTKTVLGRSTKLRGELSGSEDLLVEGDFEGVLRFAGAKVTIGREARVRAQIQAQDVLILGRLEGEIHALGSVSLYETAVVVGDIFSARFSMEEGAVLRGEIDPARAGEELRVAEAAKTAVSAAPLSMVEMAAAKPAVTIREEAGTKPLFPSATQQADMPFARAGLAAAMARSFEAPTKAHEDSEADRDEMAETKA